MLFGDIQNLAHDWALELIWENGSWKDEKRPSELLLRERESDRQGFFKTVRTQIENTLGEVSPQYEALITAEENDLALRVAAYGLADQILNGNPNLGPNHIALYGRSTNGPAMRVYTMNYAREIMNDPESYSLYGSASAMDMDAVRKRYEEMLNDPLVQEAENAPESRAVTLEDDIAFEITYGGNRFDPDDVAVAVGPMTRGEMAAFRLRIMDAAMGLYPQQSRDFVERGMDAFLSKVEIREQVVEQDGNEEEAVMDAWARYDADGYEVSTGGDRRFSALVAKFADGTHLGDVDISGMTVEEVYQHIVKRSGKGLPPAEDSILHNPALHTDGEREDYSYENGYLPLWTMWARQNPRLVSELRRKSAGRPLTDKFASTSVTQARALADIIRGNGAEFSDEELLQYFSGGERLRSHPSLTPERLADYDLYSVGMGRNTKSDFFSMIPPDTDVIVDLRNYRYNTHYEHFDIRQLQPSIEAQGLEYVWIKDLSGRSKVPGARVGGTDRNPVIDYDAYAASQAFKNALDELSALVRSGKKVCVVGSATDAAFDARGLLLGQELERTTNLRIAHIDNRTDDGAMRIRSQEDVIRAALGRGSQIEGGDYLDIRFRSDRSYNAAPGVTVKINDTGRDAEDRLIHGNLNFASEITISEEQVDARANPSVGTPFRSSMARNAERADLTVIISVSGTDPEVKEAMSVSHDFVHVVLARCPYIEGNKVTSEDLRDEAVQSWIAEQINDRIAKKLVNWEKYHNHKLDNASALKINWVGTNEARLANTFVEEKVTEEEISGRRQRVLDRAGLSAEDLTGADQEVTNECMIGVFRTLSSMPDRVWDFGEQYSNGQTGIAEAAMIAGQSLGLRQDILAPKGYLRTIDNETLRGLNVPDRASFINRFHQGMRNEVSLQNLQEQIETLDRRRQAREDGMQTGLTDRQVLVLHELGFSNGAIVDMIELAENNRVSVNSPSDMADFIEAAAGYGISGTEGITEETVSEAFTAAAEKQQRWYEDGITFVTAASPYYPDNLRRFKEEVRRENVLRPVVVDGETTFVPEPHSVVVRRPAMLWVKGDLSLLDSPGVSVVCSVTTSNDGAKAARLLGGALSDADMPVVAALPEGLSREVAREAALRGGRVIAVSDDGIATVDRMEEINRRIDDINGRLDEVSEADDEYDELIARRDELFKERVAAENDALTNPEQRAIQDEVVKSGGLVVSEREPGRRTQPGDDRSRAEKISTALGYGCAVIDATFSKNTNPMSPVAMAAYALYGVYYFSYKAMPIKGEEAGNGEERRPVKTITPTGEGFSDMLDEVNASYDNSFQQPAPDESVAREATMPMLDAPQVERAEPIPSFFDYFFSGEKAQEVSEQAADESAAPVGELRQAPVHVVTYDGRRIFLVPDSQPRIVAALRREYGDDVLIASQSAEGGILRRLSHNSIVVDGEEVPRFSGYKGTQLRNPEPGTETVYFYKDQIYDAASLPSGVMGMGEAGARAKAGDLWKELVDGMKAMQAEFQRAAGVDVDGQVRFENADHLRIGASSVDILRGDELRARIFLDQKGIICKKNFGHLSSDDFQEYYNMKTFPVFSNEDRIIASEDVAYAIDETRQTLWERPYLEVREEMEANLDREKGEERAESLRNDFLEIREDNMDIAAKDITEGMRQGLIISGDGMAAADRAAVFAMADKVIATDEKNAAKLGRDIDRKVAKLEALPAGDESEQERVALEDELDRLIVDRQRLFVEMADMKDIKTAMAHERSVLLADKKDKTMTLNIGGRPVTIKTRPVSKEDLANAAAALEDYRANKVVLIEKPAGEKRRQPVPAITFRESNSASYPARTRENTEAADVTVDMAVDFKTDGENLTKKVAGEKFIGVQMRASSVAGNPVEQGRLAAAEVARALKEKGLASGDGISINFAGNGIYTLKKYGVTQEAANDYATALLSSLINDHGIKVSAVRSGGQTGMDEAGAKAGLDNGIPTEVLCPKGWKMRGEDWKDISDEAAFKARFGVSVDNKEAISQPVPANTLGPEDREKRIAELGKWLSDAERDPMRRETAEFSQKKEEVQRLLDEKKAEADGHRRGLPEGVRILSDFDAVNGVCIVGRRDGQKAYADKKMRVISNWYEDLTPMGRTFGTAKRADGTFKFIDATGREIVSRWLQAVSKSVEGMNMVKVNDKFNFLDLSAQKLISDTDYVAATNFHEGFAIVENEQGKYNYLKKDGGVLCNSWLDSATEFKDGVATVTQDGNAYKLGNDGKVKEVISNERDKGRGNGGSKID